MDEPRPAHTFNEMRDVKNTFLQLEGNGYSFEDVQAQIMHLKDPTPRGHVSVGSGDISQMAIWKRRLREAGFEVAQSDVYTTVHSGWLKDALAFLWKNRVEGWWLLQLVEHGICSQKEFDEAYPV